VEYISAALSLPYYTFHISSNHIYFGKILVIKILIYVESALKIHLMSLKIASVIALVCILISGCPDINPEPFDPLDDSEATEEGVKELVDGANQLSFDLYNKWDEESGAEDNIFFSSWSISSALGMTYEGAKGQTATEMQQVLHLPSDDKIRRAAFARMYNTLNEPGKDYALSTANSLWAQEDFPFLDSFLNTVKKYYGGGVTNLDFAKETEASRVIINEWVEEQTNNKIKDLIPPGILSPMTRMVLTNAIYFKGNWLTQFDPEDTSDQQFRVSSSKTVTASMMRLTDDELKFKYSKTDDLQVLELPYKGEELSMLILLPVEDDISAAENALDLGTLDQLRSDLQESIVHIYLPKFKFETKYMMSETLQQMGMPTAFDPYTADLTGMFDATTANNLYISEVIHQAFVEVNEEGTEAAAATAVIVTEMSMPNFEEFRADHPFIFLIQDNRTGAILFMGRVMDPTTE